MFLFWLRHVYVRCFTKQETMRYQSSKNLITMQFNPVKAIAGALFLLLINNNVFANDLVSRDFPVRSFNEVELRGLGNIFITQGDRESVRIETDTTTLSTVELENEENKLTISSTIDFKIATKPVMNIYITVVHLQNVQFKDVGAVTSTNELITDTLNFSMTSAGKVSINLQCKQLNVQFAGVGSFVAKGKVSRLVIDAKGVGNVQTKDLIADDADVSFKGVGGVDVYAKEKVTINANGIGKVVYRGHPHYTDIHKAGIGTVKAE